MHMEQEYTTQKVFLRSYTMIIESAVLNIWYEYIHMVQK